MGMVNLQLNNNLLVSFLNMEEQKTNALNKLVAKLMQTVNNKLQIYCAKLPLRILVERSNSVLSIELSIAWGSEALLPMSV